VVAVLAFAGVEQAGEVAGFVVVVLALVEVVLLLGHRVGVQAVLIVVVVVAEQLALLSPTAHREAETAKAHRG